MQEEYKNFYVTIEYKAKVTAWSDIIARSEQEARKIAEEWDATDYCLQKTQPYDGFEIVEIDEDGDPYKSRFII